ncbi:MAG: protein kinase domain-containing protein, partial [Anaerolineales bacterium]
MIGQMVSHYHILEKLGEGGMGVVYRAEDTRLKRSVALKVLSSQFARDPERRERFRQEARAAAALTHPGIATVYELEEVGEELYIVFEFVRGESLRKVVNRTRINPETLLDVATDITRALVAAHTHGVVHRDLKPENIIRTPEGHTKILDFGLARFTPAGLSPETVSTRLTDPGAIVGTISYMSPEQLEGREVDFRSDIFSFGILLYELATGTQPFEGASPASTMARIMAGEPVPLTQRNPVAPPELERIVRKCLRKRAEERYQSTADLMVDLENLHRDSTQVSRAAVPPVEEPEQVLPHHLITRMGQSPRLWWELNHLFMMAGAAIPAYIAWQVKEWVPGWGLSFFFAVLGFVAVLVTLRGYLLVTAAFNPRALSREVRRVEPFQWALDLLFMVALLVMAVTIATTHTLSAAILFFIAIGGIVVRTVVEPTIARAAFPQAFASTETTPGQAAPAVLAPRPGLRRAAWMGGAAALLGLALAFTVGGWREKLFGPAAPIPPLPATAGPINSLAVLPLENLSGDPEQEYFVEGMHEELIARLAKISALKVISRTSVMRYKQALKPVSEIGRELDVDAVIEGSVRRAGNQVRITVQLVEAATDKHLWAESYDRDLSDILALQSEVAQA